MTLEIHFGLFQSSYLRHTLNQILVIESITSEKFSASDGAAYDYFGCSVAISEDTIVVGAYGFETAYVFSRNHGGIDNWGEVTKLTHSNGALSEWFGYSIAISVDTIIAGAPLDDINYLNQGTAYLYKQ